MLRRCWILFLALALAPVWPSPAPAQVARAAGGAAVGALGGVVITLSAVVARARFQREYLDSPHDLIHWQTTPMIVAPATGALFGLAGDDAFQASVVGSTVGMLVGAAVGAGVGWAFSPYQEGPWSGGVIGAGLGLAAGGVVEGLRAWSQDEDADLRFPELLRLGVRVAVP